MEIEPQRRRGAEIKKTTDVSRKAAKTQKPEVATEVTRWTLTLLFDVQGKWTELQNFSELFLILNSVKFCEFCLKIPHQSMKTRMISLNFASARLIPVIGDIFGESFLVAALQGGDLLIPENKPSAEGLRGFMRAYAGLCGLIGKKYF